MKLSIKTLQGKTFQVDCEMTDTIGKVKSIVEGSQGSAFAAAQQKLIHAGKVLKDDETLENAGVTDSGFLVCMVTKPKASPREAAAAAATATTTTAAAAASSSSAAAASTSTVAVPPSTSTSAVSITNPSTTTSSDAHSRSSTTTTTTGSTTSSTTDTMAADELNATVRQLCDMGFPEDQVRAALRAAFNNPDRAVEYLMNGIPEDAGSSAAPIVTSLPSSSSSTSSAAATGLEAIRLHPQFDQLRQMVQSNPSTLPAVLQQIGNQSPEFLRLIHENQEDFIRMLNEPITGTPSSTAGVGTTSATAGAGGPTAVAGVPGGFAGVNPAQMLQLIQSLPPAELASMAASMGMSADQLRQVTQMMSTLPPEAINQMMQSMPGAAGGILPGGAGGGGGGGGSAPPAAGVHTIQLTEEEAAAVNRLCDMGFDRNDVIQAYLACEKNEALAANFLMDSMTADFGSGGDSNDDIYE